MKIAQLKFDWKVMGVTAYVPFVMFILLIIYPIILMNPNNVIPSLEAIIPALSSWWIIYIFQDVLEEEGSETLFTYPVKRLQLGMVRVIVFYLLYIALIALYLSLIKLLFPSVMYLSFFTLLSSQSLFFTGLGFFIVALTHSTNWALVTICTYSTTQILTKGELFSLINVYTFNTRTAPLPNVMDSVYISIIYGVLFLIIGQIIFKLTKRYR